MKIEPFCTCSRRSKHICSWQIQLGCCRIELRTLWWLHFCVVLHTPVSSKPFSSRPHTALWWGPAGLLGQSGLFCSKKKHGNRKDTHQMAGTSTVRYHERHLVTGMKEEIRLALVHKEQRSINDWGLTDWRSLTYVTREKTDILIHIFISLWLRKVQINKSKKVKIKYAWMKCLQLEQ